MPTAPTDWLLRMSRSGRAQLLVGGVALTFVSCVARMPGWIVLLRCALVLGLAGCAILLDWYIRTRHPWGDGARPYDYWTALMLTILSAGLFIGLGASARFVLLATAAMGVLSVLLVPVSRVLDPRIAATTARVRRWWNTPPKRTGSS